MTSARDEQAARTLELVRGHGRKALFIRADVGNRSQVDLMFREIVDQFGRIDILVNNAAVNKRKPLVDLSIEDVERVWSVALWGVFHCSQLAARKWRNRKRIDRDDQFRACGPAIPEQYCLQRRQGRGEPHGTYVGRRTG